jgi:hypothetical protein
MTAGRRIQEAETLSVQYAREKLAEAISPKGVAKNPRAGEILPY